MFDYLNNNPPMLSFKKTAGANFCRPLFLYSMFLLFI